jgi:hypothetical protein
VTPAGRRAYLEILKSYILADPAIVEWHLWDNCRRPDDREYINALASQNPKIKIVKPPSTATGTNRSINQFYALTRDPSVFYIKMDDDLVYLPPNFGRDFYAKALAEKGRYSYWSPLIVNNAICSWLLKYHACLKIDAEIMASAGCYVGWKSPYFAIDLHKFFLSALRDNKLGHFRVPDFQISLARYSINCIGYFGDEAQALGDRFCPLDVDDEEWISAVLPSITGKPGRILGDLLISHFSFFTQEDELIEADLLKDYYLIAGLDRPLSPPKRKRTLREKMKKTVLYFYRGHQSFSIQYADRAVA